MCASLSVPVVGWKPAPTSHHYQHNHSTEDDCIADCICCPCNLICYILLAIEEFLCCWDLLNCFGGGEFKYLPGGGETPQHSLHTGCERSVPGEAGPRRPTLQASKSAPGLYGGGRGPRPSQLKSSASLRYAPRFCEIEHHCWECERRRHV